MERALKGVLLTLETLLWTKQICSMLDHQADKDRYIWILKQVSILKIRKQPILHNTTMQIKSVHWLYLFKNIWILYQDIKLVNQINEECNKACSSFYYIVCPLWLIFYVKENLVAARAVKRISEYLHKKAWIENPHP